MNGVILDDIRKKKELKLPKTGGTVMVWDDILAGDTLGGLQMSALGEVQGIDSVKIILTLIADWDFVNKDGDKLDITAENVKKLPMSDFNILANYVAEVSQAQTVSPEEKKS